MMLKNRSIALVSAAIFMAAAAAPAIARDAGDGEGHVRITVIDTDRGRTVVSSRGDYVRVDTKGEGPNEQHGVNSARGDHDKTVREIIQSSGGKVAYESDPKEPRPRREP